MPDFSVMSTLPRGMEGQSHHSFDLLGQNGKAESVSRVNQGHYHPEDANRHLHYTILWSVLYKLK